MTEETKTAAQFYINYSVSGEHYMVGPYCSRRFAMSHIDDVRRLPGVSNVFLGPTSPSDKSYRHVKSITTIIAGFSLVTAMVLRIDLMASPDWLGWLIPPGTV